MPLVNSVVLAQSVVKQSIIFRELYDAEVCYSVYPRATKTSSSSFYKKIIFIVISYQSNVPKSARGISFS